MTDGLNQPMNDGDRIRLLQMENPFCVCGQNWIPTKIPFGYIRMCPNCPMSISYCICPDPSPEPPRHQHL